MAAVWMLVVVIGVVPADSDGIANGVARPIDSAAATAPRTGKTPADAVRTALRRLKTVEPPRVEEAARELLGLFREIQQDQALTASARRYWQTQVRSRLLQLADQIQRHAAQKRRALAPAPAANVPAPAAPAAPAANAPAAPAALAANAPASLAANAPAASAANVPADRLGVLAQQPAMGAGRGALGRGNAAQVRDDYGEELADLIRDVVAPQSWDTAGGNASIRYWRPGRAMIIRQTTENHDQTADVLQQLERMSR